MAPPSQTVPGAIPDERESEQEHDIEESSNQPRLPRVKDPDRIDLNDCSQLTRTKIDTFIDYYGKYYKKRNFYDVALWENFVENFVG